MTFRTRLFLIFMAALLLSVGVVAIGVITVTRRAFEESNRQHSEALATQFEHEFARHEQDVSRKVRGVADAEGTVRMAIDLSHPKPDVSSYVNDARGQAQSYQLDFLDFVGSDSSIISSSEWPARFGYKLDWVTQPQDWARLGAFLTKMDTQDGPPGPEVVSVATVRVGDKNLYVVGGRSDWERNFCAHSFCPPACARFSI